ncbi:MAG: GDP-mannose dehydrogenase, partial [Verrucomicrobia bacterium]|nr:GDP-mannose dehydrogenase [Verrucomicrobiota bacterium]
MAEYSVSPAGEKFPLPDRAAYEAELKRLEGLVAEARAQGQEVVVVMGLGFVGAVMAAIVADTTDPKTGKPGKFVIGCQ